MRKSIYAIATLLFATLTFTACLKDNDTESTPECSITSFSVGDFVSYVTVTRENGTDTTYSRTISGKNVYFNIDQVNNVISNVDSLVSWANITRLVPTVYSEGVVAYKTKADSLYRYLNNGKDSIDFTYPVDFTVLAYDGVNKKSYTVKVNKSATDADSLIWVRLNSADISLTGKSHSVVANNNLYVFAENDGTPTVCSTSFLSEGMSWTEPVELTGAEGTIDYASVVVFQDELYAIDNNGYIYRSTTAEHGQSWTKTGEQTFKQLLGADSYRLYASDGSQILGSEDMENWTTFGSNSIDLLPQTEISSVCYTSKTNSNIDVVVMTGLTSALDNCASVWYKLSATDNDVDQEWNYINISSDNKWTLPNMQGLQMFHLNNHLYATGLSKDENAKGYQFFYRSDDNGITWRQINSLFMLPPSMRGSDEPISICVSGNNIWMVQSGDKVWRGRLSSSNM